MRVDIPWIYPVRVAQLVLAIVILALTATVIDNLWDYSVDTINFVLFDSIWTVLVVFYLFLAPTYLSYLAHRHAILAVEVITMIFWFAGFIALGVWLPPPHFCQTLGICKMLQAVTVFGSFEWALFAATAGAFLFGIFRGSARPVTQPKVNLGV